MTPLLLVSLLAAPHDLVDVKVAIPDAVVDLRYATSDSFLKEPVYPAGAPCLLRRATLDRLAKVADALRAEDGTRLLFWDCYRPLRVQWKMWQLVPRKGYVAPPEGGSVHNRGGAVDLTLAGKDGAPLPMPTGYDEFTRRAWHSYTGGTAEERANRARLRAAMLAMGFVPVRMEWWHYEDPGGRKFPLLDTPLEEFLPGSPAPKLPPAPNAKVSPPPRVGAPRPAPPPDRGSR